MPIDFKNIKCNILPKFPLNHPNYFLGELAAALDDFDASIIINPLVYDEAKHRQTLEESLESIISGAALLADSRYIWVAHFRVNKPLEFKGDSD